MARYESNDVSFDVPRDWEEKTIVVFAAPPAAGQRASANVVMSREMVGPDIDLGTYADNQLVELAKKLTSFQLAGRKEGRVGDFPSLELRFGWRGANGPVEQRMLMIARKRQIFTFTATALKVEAEKLAPIMERIFASVKLNERRPASEL